MEILLTQEKTKKHSQAPSSLNQGLRKMSKKAVEMARLLESKGKPDPNGTADDDDGSWKAERSSK